MVIRTVFITLLAITMATNSNAEVNASVSSTEIFSDETMLLTISVSPDGELNKQDLSALESLFSIQQQRQQRSASTVNGQRSSKIDYLFWLSPKEVGVLGIPNFRVDGSQSRPIFITVRDANKRKDSFDENAVILTANLDNLEPYVEQKILLTIELAYSLEMRDASMPAIDFPNFDTEIIGEEQFTKNINGEGYNVYQRKIGLIPKNVGAFKLPNITFTADYANRNLGQYEPFSRATEGLLVNVKAIPESYPAGAYWLPALSLDITDNLSPEIDIVVGEHLDWQMALIVNGVSETRLPDPVSLIEKQLNEYARVYRNPPEFETGIRKDTAAITFSHPGAIEIAEVKIPWWDLESDTLKWASLPAKIVQVSATSHAQVNLPENSPFEAAQQQTSLIEKDAGIWPWASLGLAIGWVLTLVLVWLGKFKSTRQNSSIDTVNTKQPNTSLAALAKRDDLSGFYNLWLKEVKQAGVSDMENYEWLDAANSNTLKLLEAYLFNNSEQPKPDSKQLVSLAKATYRLGAVLNSASTKSELVLYPQ